VVGFLVGFGGHRGIWRRDVLAADSSTILFSRCNLTLGFELTPCSLTGPGAVDGVALAVEEGLDSAIVRLVQHPGERELKRGRRVVVWAQPTVRCVQLGRTRAEPPEALRERH
jgi:hypothetical protein